MDLSGVGRVLIAMGLLAPLVDALLVIGGKIGLGRLPGDLSFSLGNVHVDALWVYAPLATSLLLSVLLTVVVNLVLRH